MRTRIIQSLPAALYAASEITSANPARAGAATESPPPVNAGHVKVETNVSTDLWQQRATATLLLGRENHTAVWTGTEMIVYGGYGSTGGNRIWFNDGGRYNPVANTWTALATNGTPRGRTSHTAVWTGSEMIVWGGIGNQGVLNDGGRYNPASNTWTSLTTNGAPSARQLHTAVWTGREMIVWGGNSGVKLNDGGRYNPVTDTWTAVTTNGAPAARDYHTSVWTGSEMIVWGGAGARSFGDGGRYDPVTDTWRVVPTNALLRTRWVLSAVWTGREMIVWGGLGGGIALSDGARYSPAGETWVAVPTNNAPTGRCGYSAAWTGSEMIVWGGSTNSGSGGLVNDGGRYNPDAGTWMPLTTSNAPPSRWLNPVVWTGSEMIIFGGMYPNGGRNDTWSYTPLVPSLAFTRTATNTVAVIWPNVGPAWRLRSTGSLSNTPASWIELPPPYETNATSCWFIEPASESNKFYRLYKP